jgi:hypothetical protein
MYTLIINRKNALPNNEHSSSLKKFKNRIELVKKNPEVFKDSVGKNRNKKLLESSDS